MENSELDNAARGAANLLKASMGPSDEQRAHDTALSNAMRAKPGGIETAGLAGLDQAFLDDGDEFEAAAKAGKIDPELEERFAELDEKAENADRRAEWEAARPDHASFGEQMEVLERPEALGPFGESPFSKDSYYWLGKLMSVAQKSNDPNIKQYYGDIFTLMQNNGISYADAEAIVEIPSMSAPYTSDYDFPNLDNDLVETTRKEN